MKETFGELLLSSFIQVSGPLVSSISFFCAILFWVFLPNKSISLVYVVIIGLGAFIFILTLVRATYTSFNLSRIELPRIIDSKRDRITGNILCVLEPSILFSQGILVSFYYIDGNFEVRIGIGQVILIQRDGKVQVLLDIPSQGYEEILDGFGNNNENIKKKIYIKPNMNIDMLVKGERNGR